LPHIHLDLLQLHEKMDLHHPPFASSQTQEVMGKTDSAMMLARNTKHKKRRRRKEPRKRNRNPF
jgi:hypothetical protein